MPQSYDISKIKQHPYLAVFDGTVLGPLADAPKIETDIEVFDSLIYENGGHEEVSRTITRASAKITILTKNIDAALTLAGGFSRGTDIADPAARKVLAFTPITESAGEKTLTFSAAVLLPEIEYVPAMGKDHVARLSFMAYPDAGGNLFTFA
ncbi:MAG: hypothetical protein IJU70_12885 [Lentisphaeria bacterium]|nr:hypothetical protein [Lentisphaeria bacterium]